jgi:hypothetical protein
MAEPRITFTAGRLIEFKTAYHTAVAAGRETFSFDGNLYDIGYAKYLIEYLEDRFEDFKTFSVSTPPTA